MPDYSDIGFCIKQIHDRMEKHANNAMRPNGLTMMQVSVLLTLQNSAEKQMSMKELERCFGIAQSTVAGIVSRLEQKGFIEALGDASDKRVKRVHITTAGEKCCAETVYYKDEADKELLNGFSAAEKETFRKLLEKAAKNLE